MAALQLLSKVYVLTRQNVRDCPKYQFPIPVDFNSFEDRQQDFNGHIEDKAFG